MSPSQRPSGPHFADPAFLVDLFREPKHRVETLRLVEAMGPAALPAVRVGLRHPDWHVRHWCAIYLDHHGDPDTLRDLIPLLEDPVSKVRLWAVHSIACEPCKDHPCPVDVVPLLIERIERDESMRVRKMAVAMLANRMWDLRVVPVLEAVLNREQDARIRLHAKFGLRKYRDADLA